MGFDLQRIGRIAGDFAVEFSGPAANKPPHSAAAGRPGNSREIDVAPHRGTNDDQLAWLGELLQWFMTFVNEIRPCDLAENRPKVSCERIEL